MESFAAEHDREQCAGGKLLGWPLLVIAVSAFAVVVPFFWLGTPSGHDFEFHVHSWMEVRSQWHQGIVYPRWAALAYYGYGEARFIFYPPASWMLGAILSLVLPWGIVPAAYIWVCLTLSGCSMFLLARRWLTQRDAIFAAALFAVNPYYIVIVYWRSAFAELLAGALVPLVLICLLEIEESKRAWIWLACVVAAGELTNAPAALMINFSVALLAVVMACQRRSWKIIGWAALAGLVGTTLAGFYVFPAWYEQRWVNIGQVLSVGVRPQDNFLFTKIADADHNRFNLLISIVACAEIAAVELAALVAFKRRTQNRACWMAVIWAGLSTLLMFSVASALWSHVPLLEFVQLPWRWLLCVDVALALLVTMAWGRWRWRAVVLMGFLVILAVVWHRVQPPWWDKKADILEMLDQQQSRAGYEGTDEYVPIAADPYEIKPTGPRLELSDGNTKGFEIQKWAAEQKEFSVNVPLPGQVTVRLFNYPAWEVRVNGQTAGPETKEGSGEMLIPVSAGMNHVDIRLGPTWDRKLGGIVSLISLVGLVGLIGILR